MNWTGIAGIPVLVASLGLAAAYAAETAGHDDSSAPSSITLLPSAPVAANGSGDGTATVAGTGTSRPWGGPGWWSAPSACSPSSRAGSRTGGSGQGRLGTLGRAAAQPAEPVSIEFAAHPARCRSTPDHRPPSAGPSSGGTAAGSPEDLAPGGPPSKPQEIQFDPQGMITLHTDELDVRQLLELMSRQSGLNILVSPKVSGNITANFEKIAPTSCSSRCSNWPIWLRRSRATCTSSTPRRSSGTRPRPR